MKKIIIILIIFAFLNLLSTKNNVAYSNNNNCPIIKSFPDEVPPNQELRIPFNTGDNILRISGRLTIDSTNADQVPVTYNYGSDIVGYQAPPGDSITIDASSLKARSQGSVYSKNRLLVIIEGEYIEKEGVAKSFGRGLLTAVTGGVLGDKPVFDYDCTFYLVVSPPTGEYSGPTATALDEDRTIRAINIIPINPDYIADLAEGEIFTGYTQAVAVDISGVRRNRNFKVCLHNDYVKECIDKEKFFENDDLVSNADGEIDFFNSKGEDGKNINVLCHNGTNSLKFSETLNTNDDCNPYNDFFPEGSTYTITLFDDVLDTAPILTKSFYIRHIFPHVIFKGYSLDENLERESNTQNIKKNLRTAYEGVNNEDSIIEDFEIDNPIEGSIEQILKIGGMYNNSFQFSVKSLESQNDITGCVPITGSPLSDAEGTSFNIFNYSPAGGGTGKFSPGNYTFSLKKQINQQERGGCEGGFEYYKFKFTVLDDLRIIVDGSSIEADPQEEELYGGKASNRFGALPCTGGNTTDGRSVSLRDLPADATNEEKQELLSSIAECTQYQTALTSFGVKPLEFINSIGIWFFRIASVAALGILIYAGFLFQTSRGDKEKIGKAREMITAAITGLIFIILSVSILQIIGIDILRIPGFIR